MDVYKPGREFSPGAIPVGSLILDFEPPSLSYSCLSCLGCGVLLWQTNLINTPREGSTDGWEKSHSGVSWGGQADEESVSERFNRRIGCRRQGGGGRAHPFFLLVIEALSGVSVGHVTAKLEIQLSHLSISCVWSCDYALTKEVYNSVSLPCEELLPSIPFFLPQLEHERGAGGSASIV